MGISPRFSRREFVQLLGFTTAGLTVARLDPSGFATAQNSTSKSAAALDTEDVLHHLLEGNERFAKGEASNPRRTPADFLPLAEGQNPVAVIVGCADSRVPPELLFDQGIGDLFVVRVAGNVVSGAGATVKGSIEYAVAELGVSLVMVLGHSQCGAIKAVLKHIDAHDALPGAIKDLVNIIKPVVAKIKGKPGDPLDNAIKANVATGVKRLQTLEPILAPAVKQGKVKVVGATYDLRSGRVALSA